MVDRKKERKKQEVHWKYGHHSANMNMIIITGYKDALQRYKEEIEC